LAARRALISGQPKRAEALASAWLERHDPNPLRPEAFLIRGDAWVAMNDEYKALYDYEAICTLFPGSEPYLAALRRELDIAKAYAGGLKRKIWGIRMASATDEAQELMIRVQERLPGSTLAEEAGMALADYYFDVGEMTLAGEAYQLFMENYPRSAQFRKARLRLIYSRLASFKGPAYDASGILEAQAQLRTLEQIEPLTAEQVGSDAIILRIEESMAGKLLNQARWYARTGDPISAERSVRRAIERYPRSITALEAAAFGATLVPRLPAWLQKRVPDYAGLRDGTIPLESAGLRRAGAPSIPQAEAAAETAAGTADAGPRDIRRRLERLGEAPGSPPPPAETPARPRDPATGEPRSQRNALPASLKACDERQVTQRGLARGQRSASGARPLSAAISPDTGRTLS
jgi:tetratricopeptide (TPR) repeat protein